MYTQDVTAYRQTFFDAWQKHKQQLPLYGIEKEIVAVIAMHPEYQHFLDSSACVQIDLKNAADNPFLHMSLHLVLHEQLSTNRPHGVRAIAKRLGLKISDPHEAEHQMMACLAEALRESQRTNTLPNETLYLQLLQTL